MWHAHAYALLDVLGWSLVIKTQSNLHLPHVHVFLVDDRQLWCYHIIFDLLQRNPGASDIVRNIRLGDQIDTFIDEIYLQAVLPLVIFEFLCVVHFISLRYPKHRIIAWCRGRPILKYVEIKTKERLHHFRIETSWLLSSSQIHALDNFNLENFLNHSALIPTDSTILINSLNALTLLISHISLHIVLGNCGFKWSSHSCSILQFAQRYGSTIWHCPQDLSGLVTCVFF